jgi:hypothetical protein
MGVSEDLTQMAGRVRRGPHTAGKSAGHVDLLGRDGHSPRRQRGGCGDYRHRVGSGSRRCSVVAVLDKGAQTSSMWPLYTSEARPLAPRYLTSVLWLKTSAISAN